MVAPYCYFELTTFTGTPINLQPELLPYENIDIDTSLYLGQPSPRIMFMVKGYGSGVWDKSNSEVGDKRFTAALYDVMTGITNLPTFSVPNNNYTLYMANNANSLAYQQESADWAQQRALMGADLAYNQATNSMQTQSALTANTINTMNQSTDLANQMSWAQTALNAPGSIAGGAGAGMAGGPIGAAVGGAAGLGMSLIGTAVGNTTRDLQNTINVNSARNASNITGASAGYMRDTNRAYAESVARGDYLNAVAGLNAKVQDAKLLPPSIVGQVGGETLLLIDYGFRLVYRTKQIRKSAINAIGDFWLRYGYAINRYATPPQNLQCMTNFTYWKVKELYLQSNSVPELFKQTIRGILEKGVTVWHNVDNFGNFEANQPIEGSYVF